MKKISFTPIFLITLSILAGLPLKVRAGTPLQSIHQPVELYPVSAAFDEWCKITSPSETDSCFQKSYLILSSKTPSMDSLQSALNADLVGDLKLNPRGYAPLPLQEALQKQLRLPSRFLSRAPELIQSKRAAVIRALKKHTESPNTWAFGYLYSPTENAFGYLVVILKPDRKYNLTEVLLLYSSQTDPV